MTGDRTTYNNPGINVIFATRKAISPKTANTIVLRPTTMVINVRCRLSPRQRRQQRSWQRL